MLLVTTKAPGLCWGRGGELALAGYEERAGGAYGPKNSYLWVPIASILVVLFSNDDVYLDGYERVLNMYIYQLRMNQTMKEKTKEGRKERKESYPSDHVTKEYVQPLASPAVEEVGSLQGSICGGRKCCTRNLQDLRIPEERGRLLALPAAQRCNVFSLPFTKSLVCN